MWCLWMQIRKKKDKIEKCTHRLQLESLTASVSTDSIARTTSGEFHSGIWEWSNQIQIIKSFDLQN